MQFGLPIGRAASLPAVISGRPGCAGIKDFRIHDAWHTWASWHVHSGTSLPELMEMGSWKSFDMALRQAHLAPEKLGAVASRIYRQPHGRNVASLGTLPLRSIK